MAVAGEKVEKRAANVVAGQKMLLSSELRRRPQARACASALPKWLRYPMTDVTVRGRW
jgi:hypothetical protein